MTKRALVGNASSAKQQRRADAFLRSRADSERADLAAVIATNEGVRVCTTLLERWSAWLSVYDSDAAKMAYKAGKQDVAHELMAMIGEADPDGIPKVMAEHQRREDELARIAGARPEPDDESTTETESDG